MVTGPVSFSGLVSGLNTQSIINAEMAVYEQPLTNLQTEQSTINTKIADYQAINTQLLALQQSADALADPSAFNEAYSASSSASSVATANVTSGTQTGSLTFAVDQLAVGSTQISAGTVASPNDIVTSGSVLVGSGGAALGIASIAAGTGLAGGDHDITVTQSSSGATVAGTAPLAASTSIGASNDQLDVVVNGSAQTLTLVSGTYTPSQLAQAVEQASGGSLTASADASGQLSIATAQQGSTASLQVTGGTALSALALSAGPTVVGTDGVVSVDGTSTTVSDISGSGPTSVVLNSGTGGTVTVGISGGLSAGSMTADNVSVGDGSLQSVVSAINGAGVGVTANALEVGTNSYALELTSNGTGTGSSTTVDTQAFAASGLGALLTTTAAQNAVVSVGGTGGYQVTSQTNALSGLLPGITINLASVSSTPVTVTVSPDGSSVAGSVQSLVSAANQLLSTISTDTAYNSQTKTAGPLNGDPSLTGLAQQVLAAVGEAVGTSGAGSDGTAGESAGLAITSQGTITFNQAAFETAYAKNPTAVQAMFTEGGTFAAALPAYAGQVSVAGATDDTSPGSYAVSITQSAQQAVDTGSSTWASPASALSQAETYTVTGGSATATLRRHGGRDRRRSRERHERGAGRRRHRRLGCARRFRRRRSGPAGVGGLRVRRHVPGGGIGLRPARIDVRGLHLHRDGRGRHHQRPGRGGLGPGPELVQHRRQRRRARRAGHDAGDHVGHRAGHRHLRTRLRPGPGPHRHHVFPGAERHHPGDDRRPPGDAGRGRERDLHAAAAGGHPTGRPHDGVHQHGDDVVPAAVRELLPQPGLRRELVVVRFLGLVAVLGVDVRGSVDERELRPWLPRPTWQTDTGARPYRRPPGPSSS